MATKIGAVILKADPLLHCKYLSARGKSIHTSAVCPTVQAGKVKISRKGDKPVTYEQAFAPRSIAARKAWNSWNTSTVRGGLRRPETTLEDLFIRKFVFGTFIGLLSSEVIIKRQHNIIRLAMILNSKIPPEKVCFLIGYTEELLSYWLQCNVKLEVQVINDVKQMHFKYI